MLKSDFCIIEVDIRENDVSQASSGDRQSSTWQRNWKGIIKWVVGRFTRVFKIPSAENGTIIISCNIIWKRKHFPPALLFTKQTLAKVWYQGHT